MLLCREGGTTRSGSVFIAYNVVSSCEKGVRFILMCCFGFSTIRKAKA